MDPNSNAAGEHGAQDPINPAPTSAEISQSGQGQVQGADQPGMNNPETAKSTIDPNTTGAAAPAAPGNTQAGTASSMSAADIHGAKAIAALERGFQNTGSGQTPATPRPAPAPAVAQEDPAVFVMDTTATAENPTRVHDQIVDGVVKAYRFEHGKPTAMPRAVAIKFLKHDGFKLTDKDGNALAYKRRPKQPHELGAGEKFVLGEDETIARYDELTDSSLFRRVCELPGGEQFAKGAKDRKAVIDFIKSHAATVKAQNAAAPEQGEDDWIPPAEEGGIEGGED